MFCHESLATVCVGGDVLVEISETWMQCADILPCILALDTRHRFSSVSFCSRGKSLYGALDIRLVRSQLRSHLCAEEKTL
jgi:hypothetical protein